MKLLPCIIHVYNSRRSVGPKSPVIQSSPGFPWHRQAWWAPPTPPRSGGFSNTLDDIGESTASWQKEGNSPCACHRQKKGAWQTTHKLVVQREKKKKCGPWQNSRRSTRAQTCKYTNHLSPRQQTWHLLDVLATCALTFRKDSWINDFTSSAWAECPTFALIPQPSSAQTGEHHRNFQQCHRWLCWSIEPVAVSIPQDHPRPNKPQRFEDGLNRRLFGNTQGVVSWDKSSNIPCIIQLLLWCILLNHMDTIWGETATPCSAVEHLKCVPVAAGCNQLQLGPGVTRVAASQYQWDKIAMDYMRASFSCKSAQV